ncbi:15907_t:CDS:2 [Funneliformis geosporum]|uniref:867_t:CDS:1 n=1 Tax=Funneliformis geosporum TaxID=1117311 RepID=A0A9W4SND0_9GLOM|nr:15907_t:CDS:2 [Funneliformis geosporum]CAI2176504.1 867_t:CDS:2 [Funneliformis geosporum]
MSAKLSLLNLHLRLLPSKVESFIDKTKKEFKDVVINEEDGSEEYVPLDYDLIFNHPRVDLYSFETIMHDSLDYNNTKKQKKKTMYNRVKKRIIGQLSTTSIKGKVESKELAKINHGVTFSKENRVYVYYEES